MSARFLGVCAAACIAAACSRDAPATGAAASSSAASAASAPAGSASGGAASADAAAKAADAATACAGTYTSAAGSLYVPDGGEWAGTKWRGDESTDGLGEGPIALSITGSRVEGTIDGPLGPAVIRGAVEGGQITGDIARKDAADHGFTGTLIGKVNGGAIDGEMHLSIASARVIRHATFSLKTR